MGNEKEETDRGNWTGKLDFILSCIGFAVGLGNIWRFPYLAYRNGGGAFLVPYVIMLVIAGIPLFMFELSLGQFASEGPVTVWSCVPLFKGIGWAMIMISAVVCVYYNVIIMYAVYYMFVSFVSLDTTLPWQECSNSWNTENCTLKFPDFKVMNETEKVSAYIDIKMKSCLNGLLAELGTAFNESFNTIYDLNSSILEINTTDCDKKLEMPSAEYWNRHVLRVNEADGLENIGNVSLKNIICLFLTWVFIFFCLIKGIKSSGKVVYFTATFPYVVLLVLLIRGVTLDGHLDGIEFYIVPKWEELKNPKVWGDAATQIFYSLGAGFGGLMTMSSYNKFKNNVVRDALIVSLINCGTSVFGGFAIFSLLGYMAKMTNRPVEKVVDSGPGLAFVAYPEGIARLPSPAIWAFLFFFMIFTLGLDSQFAMMETVISGITDVFPKQLRHRKAAFTFFCCMVGFLLGITQTTKGGIYLLTLTDWYSGSYNLMIIGICELVAICYIYGVNNFRKDIEMMVGTKPFFFWIYWYAMWLVVTPIAVAFIVIMMAINYSPAYLGDYSFPSFAEALGWLMVLGPIVLIIITAIVETIRLGGIRAALKPQKHWGPALDEHRIPPRYAPLGEPGYDATDVNGEYPTKMKSPHYTGEKNPAFISEKF